MNRFILQKLNDLENLYEAVLDNLNRSKDLVNKRKIELLINLKKQILNKVNSLERKNSKIEGMVYYVYN